MIENIINENAARTAHEMMSFSDYKEGSATAAYNAQIAQAKEVLDHVQRLCRTEQQKERAAILYRKYAATLAAAINRDNEIGCRCPSVMISGASNFPTRKKEKQIAAWDKNREMFAKAEHYLSELKHAHSLPVESDDPDVLEYLNEKLLKLETEHEIMLLSNAYWRKNEKSLDGCPYLKQPTIDKFNDRQGFNQQPFPAYHLANSNATIKRIRERINAITAAQNAGSIETENEAYTYKENAEIMRVQFFFNDRPDEKTRDLLKQNGFKWSPKNEAWQRQLTENGKRAARRVMEALDETVKEG